MWCLSTITEVILRTQMLFLESIDQWCRIYIVVQNWNQEQFNLRIILTKPSKETFVRSLGNKTCSKVPSVLIATWTNLIRWLLKCDTAYARPLPCKSTSKDIFVSCSLLLSELFSFFSSHPIEPCCSFLASLLT